MPCARTSICFCPFTISPLVVHTWADPGILRRRQDPCRSKVWAQWPRRSAFALTFIICRTRFLSTAAHLTAESSGALLPHKPQAC